MILVVISGLSVRHTNYLVFTTKLHLIFCGTLLEIITCCLVASFLNYLTALKTYFPCNFVT